MGLFIRQRNRLLVDFLKQKNTNEEEAILFCQPTENSNPN